jgi:Sigma-70, region 4
MLGEREREVFLARSMADSDDVPSHDDFAERFGISSARVHQIEVSARRKIAVALAASGYGEVTGDDVVAHLSQIRARRASARNTFDPPSLRGKAAANGAFALRVVAE